MSTMACSKEVMEYNAVTDVLVSTFGEVLSREAIFSIVESCSGDLNYAADAIMSITSEGDAEWTTVQNNTDNPEPEIINQPNIDNNVPSTSEDTTVAVIETPEVNISNTNTISYAQASSSRSIGGTQRPRSRRIQSSTNRDNNVWSEKIRTILKYHNLGARLLILMRGAPGSGKSYLARQIVEITVGPETVHVHIFSTDDFFMSNGYYNFDKYWLSDAHLWNQRRAREAILKGVSPVIIDNTNVEPWELRPYVQDGVTNGYVIEVVEPDTPWAKKLHELKRRNTHNVPEHKIRRMLESLTIPMTTDTLLKDLNIQYHAGFQPPFLRCDPVSDISDGSSNTPENVRQSNEIELPISLQEILEQNEDSGGNIPLGCNQFSNNIEYTDQDEINQEADDNQNLTEQVESLTINIDRNLESEIAIEVENLHPTEGHQSEIPESANNTDNTEILDESPQCSASVSSDKREQKVDFNQFLEEFEKVENEWDNGEAWEEVTKTVETTSECNINNEARPPRRKRAQMTEDLPSSPINTNDWKKISMYMPSWSDTKNPSPGITKNVVETKTAETCMEIGDTDISGNENKHKIASAVSRDINLGFVPMSHEKIPENRMLDKSTMTNEPTSIPRTHRCKNEDKHFIRFRNMFKNVSKEDLRYIFDNCCGDVNWAVSIVLDDMATMKIDSITADVQSDIEEENDEPCECTAHYDIIPDSTSIAVANDLQNCSDPIPSTSGVINAETLNSNRKQKKDSPLSDTTLALKRQIEQNIVISEHFYSQECLKIKKLRHGELNGDVGNCKISDHKNSVDADTLSLDIVNTEAFDQDNNAPCMVEDVDSESDDESGFNEVEKTVNINIGHEFLSQLDSLFGRGDMVYSENIEPRINMPISLLNEINALWMESLMYQLEAESKIHEDIIRQDEEFARELAMKEEEVRQSGQETEVPNLKEVMDLEYALSLYRKDCNEWQKDRPTDLAAKLSIQKLYNLFPEIPQNDLDEIYTAHRYDFQATVGVLLVSSGRSDIVEAENGINKFVMAEELKRQQTFLNEEKERLKQLEWPELPPVITLDVVNNYRSEASTHLQNRQMSFGKAQDYMSRGMPMVASFYSDVAHLHTLKYEHAQNIAAASLMQFHAERCENRETLDLHFLRVAEAKQALDMFLDSHIQSLRENVGKKKAVLYFITGRGLHSPGGPRVKPAVKRRLRERGLNYSERNPGLLTTKVSASDKLSYQVT